MSSETVPPRLQGSRRGRVVRWFTWGVVWAAGLWLSIVSLQHILADSHRWDARITVPVREPGAAGTASFRTLTGGPVDVLATSLVHHPAGETPFTGAIALRVLRADGVVVREFVLGRGGTAHVQGQDSSWTTLGRLDAPRLWFQPWRFEARVVAPDPTFPATQIDVMLRKQRKDLGMGGMIFYVTIFVGLALLALATLLAGVWHQRLGHAPWIVSAISLGLLMATGIVP